jgi:spore germination protein
VRRDVIQVSLAALLAAPLLVVSIPRGEGHVRARAAPELQVTGYAGDWTSTAVVERQAPALTTVGVDGVDVARAGTNVSTPTAGARRLLHAAHAAGIRAVLLVGNTVGAGASTAVATRLLTSAANRARVAGQLARLVRTQGWDGITVDLEALAARDAPGLVDFIAQLRGLLPGRQLAVDVSATTTRAGYVQLGYHLTALSHSAVVVLMAYDEDGPWSGPGPIGGLPWQRAAIAAARRAVAARRLVLGVAAYGYTWPLGAREHDGTSVTDRQARQLAAASRRRPRWVAAQGEWTVRLRDGTVLWWSDVRSYDVRVALAAREGLAGLAIWQLATSDVPPRR